MFKAVALDVILLIVLIATLFSTSKSIFEEIEDRTMALKLRKGDKTRTYPLAKELLDFGHRVCGVDRPHEFIQQAADAMAATLSFIRHDERVPQDLVPKLEETWEHGFALAREVASLSRPGSQAGS